MSDFGQAAQEQIAERLGTNVRILVWVQAKNRQTGVLEPLGFWTGADHRSFNVGAETRLYYGAGNVFDFPPMRVVPGLVVQRYSFKLALTPEAKQAMLTSDPRKARIEIHRTWLDLNSGVPLGAPERRFKGFIVDFKRLRGAKGTASHFEVFCETASRALTRQQPLLRSAAALAERNPDDRFREYVETAGDVVVPWGQEDIKSSAQTVTETTTLESPNR